MRYVAYGQDKLPVIGQGTWKMGVSPSDRNEEIQALRYGIRLGLTLIDTAQMYADGAAESVVGEAIKGLRDQAFVVSKVWPNHASQTGVLEELKKSLQRLGTSYLDLYLLHWPSQTYALTETLTAMEQAKKEGLIRYFGVSNFTVDLLKEAWGFVGPEVLAINQVEYSLSARQIEHSLLPFCQKQGVTIMAYSPVKNLPKAANESSLDILRDIAEKHHVTPYTVALSWVVDHAGVVAIPKAVQPRHIEENARAANLVLSQAEVQAIEEAFPRTTEEMKLTRF